MSGTVNSLGIGSGVLTADVIDKLRANDEANIIKPLDNKITLNTQKTQAADLLTSLITSFKTSVSALDNDTLYQKRTVTGSNDNVSVSALSGSQVQDFSLEVTSIAKKNVLKSGDFSSSVASIASGDGTLNLNIAGTNYKIDYTSSTTISDLKDKINDTAGSKVGASILQTSANTYSLVLTSKETGKNQTISLNDLSGNLTNDLFKVPSVSTGAFASATSTLASGGTVGDTTISADGASYVFTYNATKTIQELADEINNHATLSTKVSASIVQYGTGDYRMVLTPKSGISLPITISEAVPSQMTNTTTNAGSMNVVQDARDASFKYNGIAMTRSSNTITDATVGLTINLLKDAGSANISITQNRDQVSTEIKGLVTSYNTLQKQLSDMTGSNKEAGTAGIFNGNNSVRSIGRDITSFITSTDTKGRSFLQYGIDIDKDGVMTFDNAKFLEKFNAAPEDTEAFFSGKTTIINAEKTVTGTFASASSLISDGISGGTMNINIGSLGYSVAYSNTTTLQEMRDSINTNTSLNTKVTASIVKYNTSDYRLVLTPKDSTIGDLFTITDSVGGGLLAEMKSTSLSPETSTTEKGVFTSLSDLIKSYTATNGIIDSLSVSTKSNATALATERSKHMKSLDARYEAMKTKFAAYDLLINKANSNFSSLKMMIQTSTASNN